MNYLDVYFSRVNHFGETYADRLKNSGIVAFEKWKARSPFLVEDLSVERGYYFSGIIETSKDKEEKKLMYLYVALDIPIQVGDILTWRQDNGAVEKWLLLQKVHKVHDQYQTFQIIKCNYNLKWIDANGYLRQSWAYAVSSVDSKVKGNFRMWHSLISPQPNKFAEIIMPRPELTGTDVDELMRGITFIIENEGWIVIECDWTSVEGIVYMSLTESKVNYQYDDRDEDVANTDKYKFPTLPTLYKVGDYIVPQFEADTLNQWEIELQSSDSNIVCGIKDNPEQEQEWFHKLHAQSAGQCIITMRLHNRPAVTKTVEITVGSVEAKLLYIEGPDQIRLDRYGTFSLACENGTIEKLDEISIEVQTIPDPKKKVIDYVASLVPALDDKGEIIPNKYIFHANAKNNLGSIVLAAFRSPKESPEEKQLLATKTVEIIPLW